ncbi:MAG TPA: hypothetical protein VFQ61_06585 [Polyangiaceae bacterium]|nr:hypothetical protein [Polyangiaceae bacterium]
MTAPPLLTAVPRGRVLREADLDWFCSHGQEIFESSAFGAVLERQATYGQECAPCERCGGSGFTKDDGTCRSCRGLGGKPRRLRAEASSRRGRLLCGSARCGRCQGRTGLKCDRCGGAGYVDTAPIGSTSERHEEPLAFTPDEQALTRYAQVSRWLIRAGQWAAVRLQTYYGVPGHRWAGTKWGRVFSLVPLTGAGAKMLGSTANPFSLPSDALLANYVEQLDRMRDATQRMAARSRVAEATRQAVGDFAEACSRWNAAVDASRSRKP